MTTEECLELARELGFSHVGELNTAAPALCLRCGDVLCRPVPQLRQMLDLSAGVRDAGGDRGPGRAVQLGGPAPVHRGRWRTTLMWNA